MAPILELVTEESRGRRAPAMGVPQACRKLADYHRSIAAQMPIGDRRALMLRAAVHWEEIAELDEVGE